MALIGLLEPVGRCFSQASRAQVQRSVVLWSMTETIDEIAQLLDQCKPEELNEILACWR